MASVKFQEDVVSKEATPLVDNIPEYGTAGDHGNDNANNNMTAVMTGLVDEDEDGAAAVESFRDVRSASTRVASSNMMLSIRDVEFVRDVSEEYGMVPTMEGENIAMLADENLLYTDRIAGKLYYSERAFYNPQHEPEYVVTVSPNIYRNVLTELHQSKSVPCGMYFCCQGGEFGAHVGASHDEDVVDITVAKVLLSIFFAALAGLSYILP